MQKDLQLAHENMSSAVNTKTNQYYAAMSTAKMLKYQSIAPAPPGHQPSGGGGGGASAVKALRKYTPRAANAPYVGAVVIAGEQTVSVQRRNARERNRVKQVNNSFAKLRQHIPQTIITDLTKGGGRGPHKKISKVDTLRIAVEYIRRLQDLVDDLNGSGSETASNSSYASSGVDNATPATTQLYYSGSGSGSSQLPSFQSASATPQPLPHQQYPSSLLTPVSLQSYSPPRRNGPLDAGCASPTSSFNSSMSSFDSGNFELPPATANAATAARSTAPSKTSKPCAATHLDAHLQLKFEPYDSFNLHEEDCTPDDEELLDYISLWQEQ